MPARLHTIVLCVTLDSQSATAWKKHMKLHPVENSYQCALCGKWFISRNNKQWNMKSHAGDNLYICALCNQEVISRNYPQTHNKGHAMDNTYPCALCFKEFISINHPKRHRNMNNGKFHITFWFNIQELPQEIFSFGNVNGRQKTSWEHPATQSLQHRVVCCWWKLVINYLCSTNFVYYGILMIILSADDITQAKHHTKQTVL